MTHSNWRFLLSWLESGSGVVRLTAHDPGSAAGSRSKNAKTLERRIGFAALKLHSNCREALLAGLAERLPEVNVRSGSFLAPDAAEVLSPIDRVLPERGDVRKALDAWIGDQPASTLAVGYLTSRLEAEAAFDSRADPLSVLTALGTSALGLAASIVDALESLPWALEVALPIPHGATASLLRGLGAPVYDLGRDLSIENRGGSLSRAWPPPSGGLLQLSRVGDASEVEAPAVVKLSGRGFARLYAPTPLVADAMELFMGVIGLCVVLGLLRTRASWSPTPQKRSVEVFRLDGESIVHLTSHEYPLDVSEFLFGLGEGTVLKEGFDPDGLFIRHQAGLLRAALSPRANPSMVRGAYWFAESLARRSNDLLSFIQGTVALEILLGEKAASDLVGIGELLANRCAYLIGKSHAERDQIRADVKAIYGTRSQIVHRGHSRLSSLEQRQLVRLRGLCLDIMNREMELCAADG